MGVPDVSSTLAFRSMWTPPKVKVIPQETA